MISLEDWEASKTENRAAASTKGKWIIILRRMGPEKGLFEHNGWTGYKNGFGSAKENNNYWMGLEKIHQLTSRGSWEVYFSLRHKKGSVKAGAATFICHNFRVESELAYYRLHINSCGNLMASTDWWKEYPAAIENLNNAFFSTTDKDNDGSKNNCAEFLYSAAFWYNNNCLCHKRACWAAPTSSWLFAEAKMAIREVKAGEI